MNTKDAKVIEDYCCMMDCVDKIEYIKQLMENCENFSMEWVRPLSDIGVPCVRLGGYIHIIEYMSRTVFLMRLRIDLYNLNKMKLKYINLNSSCGIDSFYIDSQMICISTKMKCIKDEINKEDMRLHEIMNK